MKNRIIQNLSKNSNLNSYPVFEMKNISDNKDNKVKNIFPTFYRNDTNLLNLNQFNQQNYFNYGNNTNINLINQNLHNNQCKYYSMTNNLENFVVNNNSHNEIPYSFLQNNYFNFDVNQNMASNKENSSIKEKVNQKNDKKKIKKPFIQRKGDWICFECKNFNFSFRTSCNRCLKTKEENEMQKNQQNEEEN